MSAAITPVDPTFTFPEVWKAFGSMTATHGPYRVTWDGKDSIYMTGNGECDVFNGRRYGVPMKFSATTLAVDTSFQSAMDSALFAVAQPDGKVLVSRIEHTASVLYRLTGSGELDSSFKPLGFSRMVRSISVLSNGRILLVLGGSYAIPHPAAYLCDEQCLIQLCADGTQDPNFRSPVFTEGSLFSTPEIDLQGRIYVAGSFAKVNDVEQPQVARLLSDGNLDPNFATPLNERLTRNSIVRQIGLQSNGSLLAVGSLYLKETVQQQYGTVRFLENGHADASFQKASAGSSYPRHMVVLADDSFVTVSASLRKFTADGRVDPAFNSPPLEQEAYWVAQVPDGRYLVPGCLLDGVGVFHPDGRIDIGASIGGFGYSGAMRAATLLTPERLMVSGIFDFVGNRKCQGVALFDSRSGALSSPQPVIPANGDVAEWGGFDLAAAGNDSCWFLINYITATGTDEALGRISADGELLTITNTSYPDAQQVIASGGKAFLVDLPPLLDETNSFIRRFSANGHQDVTFGGLAADLRRQLLDVQYESDSLHLVQHGTLRHLAKVRDSIHLFEATTIAGECKLIELDLDETVSPVREFVSPVFAGVERWPNFQEFLNPRTGAYEIAQEGGEYDGAVFSAAKTMPDGTILVAGGGGRLEVPPFLWKLRADGKHDPGFMHVSIELRGNPFIRCRIEAIEVDEDGYIYVAGNFDAINGRTALGLARLLPDGSVDASFESPLTFSPFSGMERHLKATGNKLFLLGGKYSYLGEYRSGWCLNIGPRISVRRVALGLELGVTAAPARPTVVEASLDLLSWTPVFTNSPGTNVATFVDSDSFSSLARYYRLRR